MQSMMDMNANNSDDDDEDEDAEPTKSPVKQACCDHDHGETKKN
jgi:hypothetical protein